MRETEREPALGPCCSARQSGRRLIDCCLLVSVSAGVSGSVVAYCLILVTVGGPVFSLSVPVYNIPLSSCVASEPGARPQPKPRRAAAAPAVPVAPSAAPAAPTAVTSGPAVNVSELRAALRQPAASAGDRFRVLDARDKLQRAGEAPSHQRPHSTVSRHTGGRQFSLLDN